MDDFTVSVRQLGQYPLTDVIGAGDLLLVQKGGLGGPYASATAQVLFNGLKSFNIGLSPPASAQGITANFLQTPLGARYFFNGYVDGNGVQRYLQNGVAGQWSFDGAGLNFSIAPNGVKDQQTWVFAPLFQLGCDGQLTLQRSIEVGRGPILDNEVATKLWTELNTVASFNGRTGAVCLQSSDMDAALCLQNGDAIATQCYVNETINAAWQQWYVTSPLVFTFMGRVGDITLTDADVTFACNQPGALARTNTPPPGDLSTRIANCAFVSGAVEDVYDQITADIGDAVSGNFAPINSPAFTGVPTAPTANPGSSTGQLATTAFVQAAVTASTTGVSSFNTRTGAIVLEAADISNATGALINSPAFTGVPTAPTAIAGNSSQQLATTAFVTAALAAFVPSSGVTSFNTRSGAVVLSTADITGAGGAPLNNAGLTGIPTAPTAAPATSTIQLATTAFVTAALAAATGVASWNGRTGAVTLQANDLSAAGGALIASPTFTGNPAAPTQNPGTSNMTLATTAFVAQAIAGVATGVTSFNTRTGAVTLSVTDITSAGGAPTASPALTGVPSAPTPVTTSSDTTIATTAFVKAAISSSALVSSFNSRTGAVTLTAADVSAAGGALVASPTFTGTPAAPTAVAGTSTTQIATTAFVAAALSSAGGVSSFNGRAGTVTLQASDVTGLGTQTVPGPGNRVLLQSTSVSTTAPVAMVSFVNLFTNTYDEYEIEVYNVLPVTTGTDIQPQMNFSWDGTTWDATASYNFGVAIAYSTGTGQLAGAVAGYAPFCTALYNGAVTPSNYNNASATVRISLPWTTDRVKNWRSTFTSFNSANGAVTGSYAGTYNGVGGLTVAVQPLRGINFTLASGGNWRRGVFNLFGIVKSGTGAGSA